MTVWLWLAWRNRYGLLVGLVMTAVGAVLLALGRIRPLR